MLSLDFKIDLIQVREKWGRSAQVAMSPAHCKPRLKLLPSRATVNLSPRPVAHHSLPHRARTLAFFDPWFSGGT